jgi:hypothetical protein
MRAGGSTKPCRDFAVGNCREAAIAISFTMITKVMRIAGKVDTGKMDPDILIPVRVGIILFQIECLIKLVLILQREGVERENHAGMSIMANLMGLIKFPHMNHLGKGKLIEDTWVIHSSRMVNIIQITRVIFLANILLLEIVFTVKIVGFLMIETHLLALD